MIGLESSFGAELKQAYGTASDIPDLLGQLDTLLPADGDPEPWFSLWSALAYQEDGYPASFAAVPHVVRALASDPMRPTSPAFSLLHGLKSAVRRKALLFRKLCRRRTTMPWRSYKRLSLRRLLAHGDEEFLACALSVTAAAKGDLTALRHPGEEKGRVALVCGPARCA